MNKEEFQNISNNHKKKGRTIREERRAERRIAILEAARHTLIEDGYPDFTLRRIAKKAHIHLKTLQHYFATKRELLLETVNYTLDTYYYVKLFENLSNNKKGCNENLKDVLKYLITDCLTSDTTKFFCELWALSIRDDDARDALDAMYVRHRHEIELLIIAANPGISTSKAKVRATLMAAQIEGLVVFIGYGKPWHPEFDQLEEEVLDRLMEYALAG
tara:strand:- start:7028 stop:7678 length:651 start_codon:yes stop_codon:yes gene_type:complete